VTEHSGPTKRHNPMMELLLVLSLLVQLPKTQSYDGTFAYLEDLARTQ
jgi:hypothetical protein